MINTFQQLVHAFINSLSLLAMIVLFFWVYQNFASVAFMFSTLTFTFFHHHYVIFMLSWLKHLLFSPSFISRFYVSSLSWVSLSCFWLSPSLYFILISVIFVLSWLWNLLFPPSFAYHKCCLHFSLYILNIIFWHGKCHLSSKLEFWLVSRGKFGVDESY